VATHLLEVGNHLSLEIDPGQLDAVRSYIRQTYPELRSSRAGIAATVSFAGCDFLFQNDWDDPCLISGSTEGDAILRSICARFNGI
jgi:hypothetical protein